MKENFRTDVKSGAEVLHVKDLHVNYYTDDGVIPAADRVSFTMKMGERLGLVGESGSGKSTLALAMLGLIRPPGRVVGGEVLLDGTDLTKLSQEGIRGVRGRELSMIPQGAMNSLNPVMRVRDQLIDTMQDHNLNLSRAELHERALKMLDAVKLDRHVAKAYPHELSGGMKQRVCIAIGIIMHPKVIIADEPTSALDVVIQRQVMETLGQIQRDIGSAIILIGHDMGLMAQFVDRIAVMYAGNLMEIGDVKDIFTNPLHPYTRLLISSLPTLDTKGLFSGIPGIAPSLLELPSGCVFHPRCPDAVDVCVAKIPLLEQYGEGRCAACHLCQPESGKQT